MNPLCGVDIEHRVEADLAPALRSFARSASDGREQQPSRKPHGAGTRCPPEHACQPKRSHVRTACGPPTPAYLSGGNAGGETGTRSVVRNVHRPERSADCADRGADTRRGGRQLRAGRVACAATAAEPCVGSRRLVFPEDRGLPKYVCGKYPHQAYSCEGSIFFPEMNFPFFGVKGIPFAVILFFSE